MKRCFINMFTFSFSILCKSFWNILNAFKNCRIKTYECSLAHLAIVLFTYSIWMNKTEKSSGEGTNFLDTLHQFLNVKKFLISHLYTKYLYISKTSCSLIQGNGSNSTITLVALVYDLPQGKNIALFRDHHQTSY